MENCNAMKTRSEIDWAPWIPTLVPGALTAMRTRVIRAAVESLTSGALRRTDATLGMEDSLALPDDDKPTRAFSLGATEPLWGARPTWDSKRHKGFTPAQAGPSPTVERDPAGSMGTVVAPPSAAGRTITSLATLPGQTLLDETALAGALGLSKRTVRRMVSRHELPPPFRFAGFES
jgi:hypothetical protein